MTPCTHCYRADATVRVVYGVNRPDGTPERVQTRMADLCDACCALLSERTAGAVATRVMHFAVSPLNANAPAAV